MWLECPLCLNRCEVEDESKKMYCGCGSGSPKGQLMHPAPWDKYLDEKLWAMYAAHAQSPNLYTHDAARLADEMLIEHKKRWSQKK